MLSSIIKHELKNNNFDLLRLFAASQVMIFHSLSHLHLPVPGWLYWLDNFSGVPMFFVMSGFLISASLERNFNLKNYFRNRALRIYPALWFCIILTIVIILIFTKISFINNQSIPWFLSQIIGIIYTPNFLLNYGFGSYNGSLWTIPIELQFYIVLPIVYFLLTILIKKENLKTVLIFLVFILFLVISYCIDIYYPILDIETKFHKILRYSFVPHIYLFFLGVFLQRVKAFRSKILFGKGLLWVLAYLLFCILVPSSELITFLRSLFLGLTTISLAYTFPGIAFKLLKGNDISYGVYIYHGMVLGLFVEFKLTGDPLYIFIIFFITIFLSFLSWILIEKPMLSRKKLSIHKI